MKIFSPTTCHSPKVSIDQLFAPKMIGSAEVYTFGDDQEEPQRAGHGGDEGNSGCEGQGGDRVVEPAGAIPPEILRKLQDLERRNEELEIQMVLRESVSSKEGEHTAEEEQEIGQQGQLSEETRAMESHQAGGRAAREEGEIRRRVMEELRAEGMLVQEKSEKIVGAAAAPVDEDAVRKKLMDELMLEGRLVEAGSRASQAQAMDEDAVRKKLMGELERGSSLAGGGCDERGSSLAGGGCDERGSSLAGGGCDGASGSARGGEHMPGGVVEKDQGAGEDVRSGGQGGILDEEVEKMRRETMEEREKLRVEREEWRKRMVEEEEAGREGLQRQKEEMVKQKQEMERLMRLKIDESEKMRHEEVERLNKIIQDERIARDQERMKQQQDEMEQLKAKIVQLEQANASLSSNNSVQSRPVYSSPPVPVSYQPQTTAGANHPLSSATDGHGSATAALYPSSGGEGTGPAMVATTHSPSASVAAAATVGIDPAANFKVAGGSTVTPVDTHSVNQGVPRGYTGGGQARVSTEKQESFAGVKKKSSACVIQ